MHFDVTLVSEVVTFWNWVAEVSPVQRSYYATGPWDLFVHSFVSRAIRR